MTARNSFAIDNPPLSSESGGHRITKELFCWYFGTRLPCDKPDTSHVSPKCAHEIVG